MFKTIYFLHPADLHLFDGEGGAGDGAAAGGDQGETGKEPIVYKSERTRRSSGDDTVVYGKQTTTNAKDAAGPNNDGSNVTSSTAEERKAEFQRLIRGEYKDLYGQEVQRIIDRRFGETKNLETAAAQNQPILDMLYARYNIEQGKADALMKAIEADDAYWQEAADEAGMDVDTYRSFQKLQRENASLLAEQKAREGQMRAQQQMDQWLQEAEDMKTKFPDFDLQQEVQNPEFLRMLQAGNPIEHAYKIMHFDELMGSAMATTQAVTEKRVADTVRAQGARPQEAGTSSRSSFVVKDDVSKLTKADRAAIAARVARGEVISF